MKHKYTLLAWSLTNSYVDFKKTIYKRKKLTSAQEKKLLDRFCYRILDKHNVLLEADSITYEGMV